MQQHFYQKINFIKVVNICMDDAIFVNCVVYENKLILYNYKIFSQSFLIVDFLLKLHIKQWLLLYKVFCLLWFDVRYASSIA